MSGVTCAYYDKRALKRRPPTAGGNMHRGGGASSRCRVKGRSAQALDPPSARRRGLGSSVRRGLFGRGRTPPYRRITILDENSIYRGVALLHPKLSAIATSLSKDLIRAYETGRTQFRFEIFETFRSPARQIRLKREGTSKAGPWQSAHQFGLAVDFVPFVSQAEASALGVKVGWYWPGIDDPCWKFLDSRARTFGVSRTLEWDGPHVEHPLFEEIAKTIKGADPTPLQRAVGLY